MNSATTACDKGNQWTCSLWLLMDMRTKRCQLDSLIGHSAAMAACARFEAQWAKSLVLFERLPHHRFTPDLIACNSVMHACATGSAVAVATYLVSRMQQHGPLPDLVTFNTFITSLSNSQAWLQCLEILDSLEENGALSPSVVTYNAVISSLGQEGWRWSLWLLEKMRARSVRCDVVTAGSILSTLARAAQSDAALSYLSILERDPALTNEVVYSAAVSACEGGRLWKESIALIVRARSMKLKTDAVVYGAACSTCQKSQLWEHAVSLLGDARYQSTVSTPLSNAAISACADSAQWLLATRLLQVASYWKVEADTTTCNACLTACVRQWEMVVHMMGASLAQQVSADTVGINAAISSLATDSIWARAIASLRGIPGCNGVEADIFGFNSVLTALARSKHWAHSSAPQLEFAEGF